MKKTLVSLSALLILASFSVAGGGLGATNRGSLYLVINGTRQLDIYDPVLQKKTGSMTAGESPVKAALSPDGKLLAVTQKETFGESPEAVWIFDGQKMMAAAKVEITLTRYRRRGDAFPIFSKDSKKLYTAEPETGFLNVIDTSNWRLVKKLALGVNPLNPSLSPDGRRLYVPCLYSGAVSVIDTEKDLVVDTIKIDGMPSAVTVDPGGKLIYVSDRLNNNVWVMDAGTGTVVNKHVVGSAPSNLMLIDGFLYVLNTHSSTLSVIDVKKEEDVRSIGIGLLPSKMAFDPESRMLYVVSGDSSISVVNTANNERLKSIPIDSHPSDIVFVP